MSALRQKLGPIAVLAVMLAGAAAASGCTTDAFCFSDCGPDAGEPKDAGTGGAGGGIELTGGGGEGGCLFGCTDSGPPDACTPTNEGKEICDGLDNDCNGVVDDADFSSPKSCGTCQNDCYTTLLNVDPATITCDPSGDPGKAGTCKGTCSADFFDLDGDGACEYYCVKSADDDSICNNKDDDCDGQKDEEVDVCTSTTDCGGCGHNCVVLHGTPACLHEGNQACDTSNTHCQIQTCACNGPGDCWWDLDNSYATGCEYQCDVTNGGVEICDGIDNDCDGKIDNADDLSGDPNVGVACHGSNKGECATAAHAGTSACLGGQIVCAGPNVLFPDQQVETCNAKDDDCDGAVDDQPTDVGGACGQSNVFPCSFGAFQCVNGALTCIGAVNPGTETCNGQDDNCDGTIDKTGNNPPADSQGPCNVPPAPPPGATSPCKAGAKACVGGAVACVGSVGPSSPTDTCGVDANCDGQLTSQPNLATDVANCGACGNNCYAGSLHANFTCNSGTCKFQGCQSGYYDLNGDGKCEYACAFVSAQETCNGLDDNCNGQVDENVQTPSPTQVCGVSPSATRPECTSAVSVACVNGSFKCSFPAGVCTNGNCGATAEICDTLDNNCNGGLNENVPNYNKPCASDDGKPPPGDGACRTTGTFVCNGTGATKCSATKDNSKAGPELCDGLDNDCDGAVDEPFTAKGTNTTYYVKPAVTKVSAGLWVFSYEASRPSAGAATPGTGNGYFTSAPAGVTLDKTRACSVQGKIPWFNVTPREVEQTCTALGGMICDVSMWQTACHANQTCKWGYSPAGAACKSAAIYPPGTKYCNLGPFDFSSNLAGDQDGLLVTGSPALMNCGADFGLAGKLFDLTGNLREITKFGNTTSYPLMGGAYNTQSEDGAACDFDFYTVDQSFQLYDVGFRCCFSSDPT